MGNVTIGYLLQKKYQAKLDHYNLLGKNEILSTENINWQALYYKIVIKS